MPPFITGGSAIQGVKLTGNPGTWVGAGAISYGYIWLNSSNPGASGIGPTGTSYILRPADVGLPIEFVVTATDVNGTSKAASQALGPVLGLAPANVSPPTVTGDAVELQTLVGTAGTWGGTPPRTLAFQWLRFDADGTNPTPIDGATGLKHKVTAADIGSILCLQVTATNAVNSAVALSAVAPHTNVVTGRPPANTAAPVISGVATKGLRLTTTKGTWTGTTPITYAYQWYRCNALGNNPIAITGATGNGRTLAPADVGHTMRVQVTATNVAGAAPKMSDPSDVVSAT